MKCTNMQFGELEFGEDHIVFFPEGIIGFEHCRKFLIINDEATEPFRWLVSVEDTTLSFALLDPSSVMTDYQLGNDRRDITTVFLIATLSEHVEDSTVNLRSPIVINDRTHEGRQVILANDIYSMSFPLFVVQKTD